MKADKLELVRGSHNVFRDLDRENADIERLKALLAAEIHPGTRSGGVDRPRRGKGTAKAMKRRSISSLGIKRRFGRVGAI
jgi:hypothetical protein